MSKAGNKGEWSEVYVLLKLLGDKKVYAGDKNLKKVENIFYPILKILRDEQNAHLEYKIDGDIVIANDNDTEIARVPVAVFLKKSQELLQIINTSKGVFTASPIEEFMKQIHCSRLRASSRDKTDIKIVIHDLRTGMNPLLGFSIKSQLGGASTLLNAGSTTNFIYQVQDVELTSDEIEAINAISGRSKIRDRMNALLQKGATLRFKGMQNKTFRNNLVLIDSCLPKIVAQMLLTAYETGEMNVCQLIEALNQQNPLGYDMTCKQPYYEHKVKQLLVDIALGMMPAKAWQGQYEANGGYLVVKSDGEVLCYHFYDRNLFEDYLCNNTRLESASTSRYDFAKLYLENGDLLFKLNLQIRFY